jgi:hypothetical protein
MRARRSTATRRKPAHQIVAASSVWTSRHVQARVHRCQSLLRANCFVLRLLHQRLHRRSVVLRDRDREADGLRRRVSIHQSAAGQLASRREASRANPRTFSVIAAILREPIEMLMVFPQMVIHHGRCKVMQSPAFGHRRDVLVFVNCSRVALSIRAAGRAGFDTDGGTRLLLVYCRTA